MTMRIIEGSKAARAHIDSLRDRDDEGLPSQVTNRLRQVFGRAISAEEAVAQIVSDVRRDGDRALRSYTRRIEGVSLEKLSVGADAIRAAYDAAPADLRAALHLAADRIRPCLLRLGAQKGDKEPAA